MSKDETSVGFKLLIIGDSGTGKTSILTRLHEDRFLAEFKPDVGFDIKVLKRQFGRTKVVTQTWDSPGRKRFRSIACSFYNESKGVIIVYDVTDRASFEQIPTWMELYDKRGNKDACRALVGNKADLEESRVVTKQEGISMAEFYNVPFYETSAKDGINIMQVFEEMVKLIFNSKLY